MKTKIMYKIFMNIAETLLEKKPIIYAIRPILKMQKYENEKINRKT
jgi:hypothetical protein